MPIVPSFSSWLRVNKKSCDQTLTSCFTIAVVKSKTTTWNNHHLKFLMIGAWLRFHKSRQWGARELTGGKVAPLGRVWNQFLVHKNLLKNICVCFKTTCSRLDKLCPDDATLPITFAFALPAGAQPALRKDFRFFQPAKRRRKSRSPRRRRRG